MTRSSHDFISIILVASYDITRRVLIAWSFTAVATDSFVCMEFYGPVNTFKIMSSWSVNLFTLFLDRLRHKWLTTTKIKRNGYSLGGCASKNYLPGRRVNSLLLARQRK